MASRVKSPPAAASDGFPRSMGRVAPRALALAGYTRLEQLAGADERELLALHGVGPKAIRELKRALEEQGLSLGAGKKRR